MIIFQKGNKMDVCELQIRLFVEADTSQEAQQCADNIWAEIKDCIVKKKVEEAEAYWKMESVYVIQCRLIIKKDALVHLQENISDNWITTGAHDEELIASRTNEKCSYMRDKIVMVDMVVEGDVKRDKIQFKIEKGTQLGVELRVEKDSEFCWYSYAVQKKEKMYYVYECEILESNMEQEKYEYETITKYLSLEDVIKNYPCKYGTSFDDIHPFKGQRIFEIYETLEQEL